jgi:hypothetical protein
MATYVLVHGGWSGAHTFRAVRRPLRAAGHDVFSHQLKGVPEEWQVFRVTTSDTASR